MEKVSYERCAYVPVDDESLSWDISLKRTENRDLMQQRVNKGLSYYTSFMQPSRLVL